MNLDKKALAGFIKEVEDSRTRQKGETELQRDVFKRARGKHFDVKALRIVLQRRAMETTKRDEQDYNVHAYELALGGKKAAMDALEAGASTREAARAGGISNGAAAALAKGAQEPSFVSDDDRDVPAFARDPKAMPKPPHDTETGEIAETHQPVEGHAVPEETNQPLQAAPPAIPSHGGLTAVRNGGGDDDARTVTAPTEVARVAPPASPSPTPEREGEEAEASTPGAGLPLGNAESQSTPLDSTPPPSTTPEMGAERALASEPQPEIDLTIPAALDRKITPRVPA